MAGPFESKARRGKAALLECHWWWPIKMEQGKILITEDEESLRFVLQKALETEGYWVQTAANGTTARRLLTDNHFDVSLMDIKLPDCDGLDLLKDLKEHGVDTAMI